MKELTVAVTVFLLVQGAAGWFRFGNAVPSGLDGGAAAVGGQDRAGGVAGPRRGGEADEPGDLLGARGAAPPGACARGGGALGEPPVGIDPARRRRHYPPPHPAIFCCPGPGSRLP